MAVKSKVIKEFPEGKNIYKVGEVKTFSDEITAKHADCLEEVKEKKKSFSSKQED